MVHRIFLKSLIQMALPILSATFIAVTGCGGDSIEDTTDAKPTTHDGGAGSSNTQGTGGTTRSDSSMPSSDSSTPSMDSSTSTGDGSIGTGGVGGTGTMDSSIGTGGIGVTGGTSSSGNGGGGGEAGNGGTGGEGTGGSGGTDDTPLMCNGEVCEAPSNSFLTPCCVEDGNDEICGGRLNDGCLPWEMGGDLDSTCPDYEYSRTVILQGCCTPDDMCGVWSTQGLECIERTDLDDYLGLEEELPARECGIVDEDAGA